MESGQPSTKHRAGPLNHVSNKNQFKTRREPLQRATLRIKLHIPLIKLIKRTIMCYSAAPSTTNQNATQRIYIKDIKWLGNPYRHTVLKCSMKMYLKVIGCSCYTCLPRTAPAAAQTGRKTATPGTGTGAPQLDQRLLTNTWPKQGTTISIQAN